MSLVHRASCAGLLQLPHIFTLKIIQVYPILDISLSSGKHKQWQVINILVVSKIKVLLCVCAHLCLCVCVSVINCNVALYKNIVKMYYNCCKEVL